SGPRSPAAARRARIAGPLSLAGAFALALALRMLPAWQHPDGAFLNDTAYHVRLVAASLAHAATATRDSLADAPHGRDAARLLPLGLYGWAAAWQRLCHALAGASLRRALAWFTALAGAAIVVPAWLAARAAAGRVPAHVAAWLAGILPAHVHRSYAWWFRYDAPGTLIAALHVALGAQALAARTPRARLAWAAASAVALVAALATWRVALLVPLIEALAAVALFAARVPGVRAWWIPQAIAWLVASFALPYLAAQGFATSTASAAIAAVTLAMLAVSSAGRPLVRAGVPAIAAAVAVWAAGLAHRGSPAYSDMLALMPVKLALASGGAVAVPPVAALMLSVEELGVTSVREFFGAGVLSWAGVLVALGLGVSLARAVRALRGREPAAVAALTLVTALTLALVVTTAMFARTKVLMAPFAAVTAATLLARSARRRTGQPADAAGAAGAATTHGRRATRRAPKGDNTHAWRTAAAVLTVAAAAGTLWQAVTLARTRDPRLDPAYARALQFLARDTASGTVVACPWERGYEVQAYAQRATLTDGLLEDPANRDQIFEFAAAAMDTSAEAFAAWCRARHANVLLVPPSTSLYGIALLSGNPVALKVRAGIPITSAEARPVIIGMMALDRDSPPFQKLYDRDSWRIYAVPQ
ncbi:MAG TPA: hypothetical protein VFK69_08170, partial [Candidatus Eisenbacteria bacterium]|nr:hypothetical protein [Candidatus Eisenbacteria bacterium]